MEEEREYQKNFCIETKTYKYEYTIKILKKFNGDNKDKNGGKENRDIDKNKDNKLSKIKKLYADIKKLFADLIEKIKGIEEKIKEKFDKYGPTFLRVAMVIYIFYIFIGIFSEKEDVILMGSVFALFYSLLTSAYFKRFSRGFYNLTGTTLINKWFISILSFGLGVAAFLLENKTHIFTKLLPFSISILNNLLMGISLVIIFYDSRQAMQGLPGTKPEEIERIEINKSFQKNLSEDVNGTEKVEGP